MYASPHQIRQMTFSGEPREALEFIARRFPLWTCLRCVSEFVNRGLGQVTLRNWYISVASSCRRCGGQLTPARSRCSRAIRDIIAAGEPYRLHTTVRDRLGAALDNGQPVGAASRAIGLWRRQYQLTEKGPLHRSKSWPFAGLSQQHATTSLATHRNPAITPADAWIPRLVSTSDSSLCDLAAGRANRRDSGSERPCDHRQGIVGPSR